ncbi:superoxide dismutase [Prevotella sp. MGM1]|uniref:superoxide dismutase n=1 Tax=Prevotella sp. MGM1 TaxID=2033405 RepID=UPI000CEA0149|nr:superoxide dismutase [Prevotella sp. MGM1]GAY27906.1 superoxide dismutase [Prevotella sp. MGM1]
METKQVNGKFELIKLPYGTDSLEPVISSATIGFHHGKHLQTYINNLNAALPGSKYENMTLEEIVKTSDGGVFNNAGQILNHNLYFTQLCPPRENNVPKGKLAEVIDCQFGSFEAFKEEFVKKGSTLFGSGWVWLSADNSRKLVITQESNAGNPIRQGLRPLLTFDVWEHAYYLDFQNRRADYLDKMWQIVNWETIERRFICCRCCK